MNLETLRLLAEVYGTSPDALLFEPSEGEMVERLRQAADVLKKLPAKQASHWLEVGSAMVEGNQDRK